MLSVDQTVWILILITDNNEVQLAGLLAECYDNSFIAVWISAYLSGYDGQFSFADIGQGTVVTLWFKKVLLHFMIFVPLDSNHL